MLEEKAKPRIHKKHKYVNADVLPAVVLHLRYFVGRYRQSDWKYVRIELKGEGTGIK